MTVPVLEARNVSVSFETGDRPVTVLRGIDLSVAPNTTVGIVGESGCGKSTLAKALVGLVEPATGEVWQDGAKVSHLGRKARRPFRKRIQMIFQDPHASLNPRLTIGASIEAPLIVHAMGDRVERRTEVARLLDVVGLSASYAGRYPHELSGGQRQRVGIARALAVRPGILIADEAVSALDVSIQGQILNLLMRLKAELSLSIVFISHDLSAVQHVSDHVVVMYLGRIVEIGERSEIWVRPLHPYTQMLIASAPVPDPYLARRQRTAVAASGDVPSILSPPSGCSFHTRCRLATAECATSVPALRSIEGRITACHHAEAEFGKAPPPLAVGHL